MHNFSLSRAPLAAAALAFLLITNFMSSKMAANASEMSNEFIAAADEINPLLSDWKGHFGGVPPFDKVKIADLKPALEAAMAENLAEIDKIDGNSAAPTFENTIAELERAGKTLGRVGIIYSIWAGTMSSPEMRSVEREMGPKLAAFNDKITQNEALFKRIEAVYNSPEKAKLTPEQQRLAWRYYTNFIRAGAKLGAAEKKRLSEINQTLAGLYTRFSQNL
ncbi:MAG TPA: hypothetical protein VK892_09300, partial [Pyrinomonadaceae bacterium]|nr:hypothetical protein [Pyrinomonadaceae bacterium]